MKKKILMLITAVLVLLFYCSAQMRVHLINVGQGCATLVEFPCAAILIDVGGETNSVFKSQDSLKAYLDDFFDRRADLDHTLQCVYLTHPHADHTRGVSVILDPPYKIKNAVTDGLEPASENSRQVRLHRVIQDAEETANENDDIGFVPVTTDIIGNSGLTNAVIDPVNCAGINPVIKVLWGASPTNPGWGAAFNKPNNHSLVIRVEYGTSSLLITGDLEEPAQRSLIAKYNNTSLLDADVYVVGHHGSRNGTLPEFLKKITPKIALIGVGDPTHHLPMTAWDHGHPNKRLLDSLQKKITRTRTPISVKAGNGQENFINYTVSKEIYATAWDNNIVLQADNAGNWTRVEDVLVPALVNINTATVTELETLPGLGPTKAQAIVTFRNANGNFTSIEQLDNVPGIGPATINLMRPYIRLQ